MGITKFFLFLTIISLIFLSYEKVEKKIVVKDEKKPKIGFENSQMYEITTNGITQIVESKKALVFDDRKELYDASIVLKKQNKDDTISTDIVSADAIIKVKNNIYLTGDVNCQLADGTVIKTEQLNYNIKNKIAKNSTTFEIKRLTDQFSGRDLYFDGIKNHIIANDTKFKIKVTDE